MLALARPVQMNVGRIVRRGMPAIAAMTVGGSFFMSACESETSRNFRTQTASGWTPTKKYKVGILGATGAVGQRFVQYLEGHPWFEVTRLGASERSEGKPYSKAVNWGVSADVPQFVREMRVVSVDPKDYGSEVDLVFSALDAPVAADVEPAFAKAGIPVFSNASKHRMVADVPLCVPPVNGDHLDLVKSQSTYSSGGYIVTNANCSTTGMVIAMKPLMDAFGIEAVHCVTLQAISGAGYPGLPSLDILDNVIPFIGGEEEKLETEYAKIMGRYTSAHDLLPAAFPLSAAVNRVHVRDGHSVALSIKLKKHATPAEVEAVLAAWKPSIPNLTTLPSAPEAFIQVRTEQNRPQTRLDRDTGRGYTTVVGRVRTDPIHTIKMFVLSHNTVMGAAGSSILNAELAATRGLLKHRS